jgi:hypothetical protein
MTPVQRQVAHMFLRGACLRVPNKDRQREGYMLYKKGWEIRLCFESLALALDGRELLLRAGLDSGRPYRHGPNRWILPVYGRARVEQLLAWAKQAELLERIGKREAPRQRIDSAGAVRVERGGRR